MAKSKKDISEKPKHPPARTPEGRLNQLIGMAFDEAERNIREHTASSQLLTQLIKAGMPQTKLELEKLQKENELLRAKTESLQSAKEVEKLYKEAMAAFQSYRGGGDNDQD